MSFKLFVFATLYSAITVNERKMWLTRDTNAKIACPFAIVWFLTSVTKEIFTSNNAVIIHVCLPPATIRASYDRLYFYVTHINTMYNQYKNTIALSYRQGWENCTLCYAEHGTWFIEMTRSSSHFQNLKLPRARFSIDKLKSYYSKQFKIKYLCKLKEIMTIKKHRFFF